MVYSGLMLTILPVDMMLGTTQSLTVTVLYLYTVSHRLVKHVSLIRIYKYETLMC